MTNNCTVWDRGIRSDCASISSPPPPAASPPPPASSPPPPAASPPPLAASPPPPAIAPAMGSCSAIQNQLTDTFPVYTQPPSTNSRCHNGEGYTQYCLNSFSDPTAVCTSTNDVTATCTGPEVFTGPGEFLCLDSSLHVVSCLSSMDPELVELSCM